jgi:hypothetical protein
MQLDFVSKEVTSSEWGGGTGTRGAIFLNEVQPVNGARRYLRKELHGQERAGLSAAQGGKQVVLWAFRDVNANSKMPSESSRRATLSNLESP